MSSSSPTSRTSRPASSAMLPHALGASSDTRPLGRWSLTPYDPQARSSSDPPAARTTPPRPGAMPSTRFTCRKSDTDAAPARAPGSPESVRVETSCRTAARTEARSSRPCPGGGDLRPGEELVRQAGVEPVVVDLPPSADDPAGRKLEPGGVAPDLNLLLPREPVPAVPQPLGQHDRNVFETLVEVGAPRELEPHAHQLGFVGVQVERPHQPRGGRLLGAHQHLVYPHQALGDLDGQRVRECVVVPPGRTGCQRVGDVPHLVPFPNTNAVPEPVRDDAQVVAMILDVGGQVAAVSPAHDPLLAPSRRFPVNFQGQLVGFDQPRRCREPLTQLPKKEHEAVRPRLEVSEPGIGLGAGAAPPRARHQGGGGAIVPGLAGQPRGTEGRQRHGGEQAHHRAISRRLRAAASALALLLAACEDLTTPGGSLATADLLMRPLGSSAPAPANTSFYVSNARATTRNLS